MPFTKTEVDIHEDYTVEAVDPAWLSQGVKSPKHLMLDPDDRRDVRLENLQRGVDSPFVRNDHAQGRGRLAARHPFLAQRSSSPTCRT